MDVLEQAVDQAGDALVAAVIAAKTEWLAVLNAADDEATQRVADLMEATRQATADLHMARGASEWLRQVRSTASTQYPGHSGHTASDFAALEKLVNGERILVGYRNEGPILGEQEGQVMSEQIFDLDGMTPEQIAKATTEGKLDALLSGDSGVIANAKADALIAEREAAEAPPVNPDMGARGRMSSGMWDEARLATASPEEIARATAAGKLDKLL